MPVVPTLLPQHEIESCIQTAHSVQRGQRLLQDEVGAGLEGLLRGRLPIHHRKGYGFGIALGLAQALQETNTVFEVVAVNNDRIVLALRQQIVSGLGLGANLDIDRDVLQRRTQHAEQVGVSADEKRVQIHDFFDTSGTGEARKVTLVPGLEGPTAWGELAAFGVIQARKSTTWLRSCQFLLDSCAFRHETVWVAETAYLSLGSNLGDR